MLIFHKRCQGQGGFTLVEMLMVMAIFGVVVMAVMSLFIPAVRSTSVQTQVSDVQANLRLAMNRMTQDLLLAGFLVNPGYDAGGSLDPGPIYWEGDVSPDDDDDLTIRSRTVGDAFARVVAYNSGSLALSDPEMATAFPPDTFVRLFAPMVAMEQAALDNPSYDENDPDDYDDYVYKVASHSTMTIGPDTYTALDLASPPADIPVETVILRVPNNTQPPMQTIRYRVNNGALERIVNGSTQILARNIESVSFDYEYSFGAVKRVDIALTGQSVGWTNDAISSAKERTLQTSVTLRNVY